MAAWFGKGDRNAGAQEPEPDDAPTGQIPAQVITDAVADADAAAATEGDAALVQLRDERSTLIQLCLYALDRARSGGVVERLEEGLAGIGVTAMRPDGQRFDPALHEAGGTVATENAQLDGVVAETEVVGFSDCGKLLRPPIVIVYATPKDTP